MTSEVAIMNRSAVALAADSAVTTGFRGQEKIFTTANKIFTLSKTEPVGVMINGHVEHFGCPWEIIIKDFRQTLSKTPLPDLSDYSKRFLGESESEKFRNSEGQTMTVAAATLSAYGELQRRINRSHKKWKTNDIKSALDEMEDHASKRDFVPTFEDIKYNKFNTEYGSIVESVNSEKDLIKIPLPKSCLTLFKKIVLSSLCRDMPTQYSTGVVIAGYGKDNLFPKLEEFTVDGGFFDRIRCWKGVTHDAGGGSDRSFISAFAQNETVESFLMGIDRRHILFQAAFLSQFMSKFAREIIRQHTNIVGDEKKVVFSMIEKGIDESVQEFMMESDRFSSKQFMAPIKQVLTAAPKEVLADIAESLVELASLRVRVSAEPESVGGPIDVAVISKGDGFIWIKRKHYFRPELNHHFTRNYFREMEQ